jgi:hypothetical protein
LYYYKAWPLLFAPVDDELVSDTGSVNPISGSGPWLIAITGMTDTSILNIGDHITATPGTGSLGTGFTTAEVTQITSSTSIIPTPKNAPCLWSKCIFKIRTSQRTNSASCTA